MLEHPVYLALLERCCHTLFIGCEAMSSDNVTSGDNQQETARPRIELEPHWVVGFVDGEGLLLRLGPPQSVCSAHAGMAGQSCLPGVAAQEAPSRARSAP